MTRQEQLDSLAEVIELMMENEEGMDLLQSSITSNYQFLQLTNNELQANLYTWPEERVDDFVERTKFYATINSAFGSIINNQINTDLVRTAHHHAQTLIDRLIDQYDSELNSSDELKKSKIIQNVLVPHTIIRRKLFKSIPTGTENLVILEASFVKDGTNQYVKLKTTNPKSHKENGNPINHFVFPLIEFEKIIENFNVPLEPNIQKLIGGRLTYEYNDKNAADTKTRFNESIVVSAFAIAELERQSRENN